jgi:hypothetical protein
MADNVPYINQPQTNRPPMLSIDISAEGKLSVRYPTMFDGGPINEMVALYLVERLRMMVEDQIRKAQPR